MISYNHHFDSIKHHFANSIHFHSESISSSFLFNSILFEYCNKSLVDILESVDSIFEENLNFLFPNLIFKTSNLLSTLSLFSLFLDFLKYLFHFLFLKFHLLKLVFLFQYFLYIFLVVVLLILDYLVNL